MSIRSISAVFEISRNTVRGYVRQFQECGLTMEKLQSIPEHHLQEMFCSGIEHSKQPSARQKELEALLPEYAARVKRKGVTVKSLYEEYIRSHPGGYQRSAFGRYLQRYTLSTRAVGHVEHYAGDQMYIGYAGDKLEIVDAETGDVRIVDVFVAILPCSHYTDCEASWSQRKEDLIKSCENALHFFGGMSELIERIGLEQIVDSVYLIAFYSILAIGRGENHGGGSRQTFNETHTVEVGHIDVAEDAVYHFFFENPLGLIGTMAFGHKFEKRYSLDVGSKLLQSQWLVVDC